MGLPQADTLEGQILGAWAASWLICPCCWGLSSTKVERNWALEEFRGPSCWALKGKVPIGRHGQPGWCPPMPLPVSMASMETQEL